MSNDRNLSQPESGSVPIGAGRAATIVVADDEWIFRASLRQLLTAPPLVIKDVYGVDVGSGFEVVGEAGTGEDTVSVVEATKPDLLLLDLDMPRMSGLDVMRALGGVRGTCRTIVLAGNIRKSELFRAVQFGVRGVVLKDAPTEVLFESILAVLVGRRWLDKRLVADLMEMVSALAHPSNPAEGHRPFGLTPREREVLTLVVAGYANKEIARAFAVSEETIKHHLTRMFDKVGASNRLALALIATEAGLVSEPPAVAPTEPVYSPHASGVLSSLVTSG
jgi:two-component system, NarL family, nitrate/nitrite response regulator NarL